jgi:hypothetical protein
MDTDQVRQRMQLGAGESQWIRAEAGTVFVGTGGSFIVVEAPRWMADASWRDRVSVDAGQAHTVESAGWVQISSATGAEMVCMQPGKIAAPRTWLSDVRRLLARRALA